jgi:hypothetical protein
LYSDENEILNGSRFFCVFEKSWTLHGLCEIIDLAAEIEIEWGVLKMLSRPKITEDILTQIRQLIEENPEWGRTRISKRLCELWDWRMPGGTLKDISCRDLLRALDKAGRIQLPASKSVTHQNFRRNIAHWEHDTAAIACGLDRLCPLVVELVGKDHGLAEFKSLISQYHYLGFDRTVGENMKYIVRSKDGVPLACLLFGSAAWSCRDRDIYIGWNHEQRFAGLHLLTNNTRNLVFPWVTVPNLASHTLALIARRVRADWETKYGHPIHLLETFVECGRFRGSCYKAANWICVGRTTGRGRDDREHTQALPEKDVYLLPLSRRWRKILLVK